MADSLFNSANNQSSLVKRNTMSANSLKNQEQSGIDFTQGQGKASHKLFFVCGKIEGYVSDKAQAIIKDTTIPAEQRLEKLEYAEIQYVNEQTGAIDWLPFLYPRQKKEIIAGLSL